MVVLESVLRRPADSSPPPYRSAPHNIEAEQALLGAILVNNEAFYRVSDFLEPEHFFEPIHQTIFRIARDLVRAGKVATPVTLKTFLDADIDIGGLTVGQYLARLAAEATTIINAEDYGRTIYDLAIRRALITVGETLVNEAYDAPVDASPRDQIEEAERRLYELAESGRYDGGFQRFAQALTTAVDMAAHAYQRDGKLSGLATGLDDLDRLMGGMQPSDLLILAGRPGMGKTALATNIGYNVAKAWRGEVRPDGHQITVNGGIVGFFSLEMSAEQLATRIIAEQTGIPSNQIRRGGISEADFERIKDYSIELQNLPFYVDETGGLSVAQLAARSRRQLRDRQAAGFVDIERQVLQFDGIVLDALEVGFADAAAPDLVRGNAGLLGDDARRQLFGRHFQREEADDAAVHGDLMTVGAHLAAPGLGDVVADIGGERRLAHAGAAGEDDEVGRLQAAHHAVEIVQPGRCSRQFAVALVGARGHVDGGGERLGKALEAAVVAPGFGELVQAPLGVLDLIARREIDGGVIGEVDHVLADLDEVASDRQVIDGMAVVLGVDDRRGLGGEPGEVLTDVQPANVDIGVEEGLERDRRCDLAGADQVAGDLVDVLVDRLEEMPRLEEIGDPVERLVVDEDGAQQRLFRLDIVRCGAVERSRFGGRLAGN